MKYLYYPGCSLEGTAKEYDHSTRALFKVLGAQLIEIPGWTCCGASAAEAESELLSIVLPARNLALAESMDESATDILVPCSACYLNLKRAAEETRKDPGLLAKVNEVLATEGLVLKGRKQVRHLLDVLASDIGPQKISGHIHTGMDQFCVAPYYGCQCLRPYAVFDDPELAHIHGAVDPRHRRQPPRLAYGGQMLRCFLDEHPAGDRPGDGGSDPGRRCRHGCHRHGLPHVPDEP